MRPVAPLLFLLACADPEDPEPIEGSGVDRDRLLIQMNGAETTALCEYTVGLGPIAGDCANGEYVMIGKLNVADCIAQNAQRADVFKMCTATVGDVEDCTNAFLPYTAVELCTNPIDMPEPCEILFTSECGGL